jgi:hypothetical protein
VVALTGKDEDPTHMKTEFFIRSEADADIDAITTVTVAAFKTLEIRNQTEHYKGFKANGPHGIAADG